MAIARATAPIEAGPPNPNAQPGRADLIAVPDAPETPAETSADVCIAALGNRIEFYGRQLGSEHIDKVPTAQTVGHLFMYSLFARRMHALAQGATVAQAETAHPFDQLAFAAATGSPAPQTR